MLIICPACHKGAALKKLHCQKCKGIIDVDKNMVPGNPVAICPACGAHQKFSRLQCPGCRAPIDVAAALAQGTPTTASTRPAVQVAPPPRPQQSKSDEVVSQTPVGHAFGGKVAIGATAAVLLALLGLAIWAFVLRDTWESDHRSDLVRLSGDTVDRIQAKNMKDGVKKYDELLQVIGDRKLTDRGVLKAVAEARDVAEPAKRKVKEAEALSALPVLESQASAFVESGNFERGIEKYQRALDLIKSTQAESAALAAWVGRISQAKTLASAGLHQKRKDEEADRKRIEEEKGMSRIKANIKGGAWLNKKAGNSEPLRGLEIYVLHSPGKNEQFLAMLEFGQNFAEELVAFWEERVRKVADIGSMGSLKTEYEQNLNTENLHVRRIEDQIKDASQKAADAPVSMESIFSVLLLSPRAIEWPPPVWAAICTQQLAGKVHTDVDGKYSIEVPGGYYCLYATFESDVSRVDWFVPVKVGEAKDIVVDLHNENAARITNK